jgi:hypothetical protein
MLGRIDINPNIYGFGTKTPIKFASDVDIIKKIYVVADGTKADELFKSTAASLNMELYFTNEEVQQQKESIGNFGKFSILLNSSNNVLELPLEYEMLNFAKWNDINSLQNRSSFLDKMLTINQKIIKNSKHYFVFNFDFNNLLNDTLPTSLFSTNMALYNLVSHLTYSLYYEY